MGCHSSKDDGKTIDELIQSANKICEVAPKTNAASCRESLSWVGDVESKAGNKKATDETEFDLFQMKKSASCRTAARVTDPVVMRRTRSSTACVLMQGQGVDKDQSSSSTIAIEIDSKAKRSLSHGEGGGKNGKRMSKNKKASTNVDVDSNDSTREKEVAPPNGRVLLLQPGTGPSLTMDDQVMYMEADANTLARAEEADSCQVTYSIPEEFLHGKKQTEEKPITYAAEALYTNGQLRESMHKEEEETVTYTCIKCPPHGSKTLTPPRPFSEGSIDTWYRREDVQSPSTRRVSMVTKRDTDAELAPTLPQKPVVKNVRKIWQPNAP